MPAEFGLGLYDSVIAVVDRAIDAASAEGIDRHAVEGVFLVGGSSMLLGMADCVRGHFPKCDVHSANPFEAVARGACRYARQDADHALAHDYCLRNWNREQREYEYVVVAPKGTEHPTKQPIHTTYVKAACEGAHRLGLVIYERGITERPDITHVQGSDSPQAHRVGTHSEESFHPLNPEDRRFILVDPPCQAGARRLMAEFGLDTNRRLTLSLRDLEEGNRSSIRFANGKEIPLPVRDLPLVPL